MYRRWAQVEAHGSSPSYERLALAVAEDPAATELVATLPRGKRQPNLVFAVLRWHGVDVSDPDAAVGWLVRHWPLVVAEVSHRRTQTNEPARCATLLPALALLPGPLAVVEVGASAGLCLLYDAWRYRYLGAGIDHTVGDPNSPVLLTCQVSGPVPLPQAVPQIGFRAGLDLHPIDASDPDARRWLQCLIWPEHEDRAARLAAGLDVAADRKPQVHAGDLVSDLGALLDQVPDGLTQVVVHSATLAYLPDEGRQTFVELLADRHVHRLGAEGIDVLPRLGTTITKATSSKGRFLISLDDTALALAHPHGRDLTWLPA